MKIFILFNLLFSFSILNSSAKQFQSELVTVITDRDIYIAGEQLLFNASIHSGSDNTKPLSNICYILLRNQEKTIQKVYVTTTNQEASSAFYLDDTLKTGYYEIVAFTNYMRNFGEKTFFRKQIIIVNRFDEWLNELKAKKEESINYGDSLILPNNSELIIKADENIFGVRTKVNLSLKYISQLNNIHVSVKEVNPYSLFLIHQKNNVEQENITNVNQITYEPEFNRTFLYGKIFDPNSNPVKNECIFLSTTDTIANLQYCFSNENGEFKFKLTNYYLGKTVYVTTRENYEGKYIIKLQDKFELDQPFIPNKINFTAYLRKYILESQNIVNIQKGYSLKPWKEFSKKSQTTYIPYVFLESKAPVYPSQFIVLNNFEDITKNILFELKIKTQQGISKGYIADPNWVFFDQPCAIFLNGVYIYNLNPILNFNSADIQKLELCNYRRFIGNIEFAGILSINTYKKSNYSAILPGSTVYNVDNFLPEIAYTPPQYKSHEFNDPLPDFRQTLYWNTNVENESISFYTSDWITDYIVEANGVTPAGKTVSSYSIIKVRKQ